MATKKKKTTDERQVYGPKHLEPALKKEQAAFDAAAKKKKKASE